MLLTAGPFVGLGVALALAGAVAAVSIAPLLLFATWAYLAWSPTLVLVGDDGVAMKWLNRVRYLPHSAVVRVDRRRAGWFPDRHALVTISLDTGRHIRVALDSVTVADALVASIRARAARIARLEPPPIDAGTLRKLAEALDRGRRVNGHDPYRALDVSVSDLWRLVEHSGARPADRADAARVLSARLGRKGGRRLARLVKTTAEPTLRTHFESMAKGVT